MCLGSMPEQSLIYICPVCGWNGLESSPDVSSYEICSCCSFEFGVDDVTEAKQIELRYVSTEGEISDSVISENFSKYADKANIYEWYRNYWVANGMEWFDGNPPLNWNPKLQLDNLTKGT